MGFAQKVAGFLVQQVAVYGLAAQQLNFMLPLHPIGMKMSEFSLEQSDLVLIFLFGLEPAFSIRGMPDEIAADAAGDAIQQQREDDCADAPTNNHAPTLPKHG